MDTEVIQIFYELGLHSLATGVPPHILKEMEISSAEENDFEQAEGYRKAYEAYMNTFTQNCRIKLYRTDTE